MTSDSVWQRLLPWCGDAGHRLSLYVAGTLAALFVPVQIVVVGLFAQWLTHHGITESPVHLGRHLQVPLPGGFVQAGAETQLVGLVFWAIALTVGQALTLWWFYSGVYGLSRRTRQQMMRAGLEQAMHRSVSDGVATHGEFLHQLIGSDIPAVLEGLRARWRALPRSFVLLFGCLGLALLVDFWIALLAIAGGMLLWHLFRYLTAGAVDEQRDELLPALHESLTGLTISAPLLARVQPRANIDRAFEEQNRQVLRLIESRDRARARLVPWLAIAASFCIGLLCLAFGVNHLTDQRGLTLASAVVLGLAMLGAAVAAARLLKLREASQTAFDSAGRVLTYLASAPQAASGQSLGMAGLREGVELEGVSLCDGRGRQLLRDLHTQFGKGEFVCVLGSDPVALQALLELLLGFGKPDVGEVLIDGTRVSDIAPQALARNILWIDETGPIWSGSVEDNLLEGLDQSAAGNLYDALRRCGVLEQLQAFSDGLATLVSPDDDRLDADMRYGVAVARAILRRPAIIVVREPVGSQAAVQEACNSQLRVLADQGALVIVWPQRLSTLRQADRVIVLRDGQMLAEGSHGELLESSELYRHLNYALFNPYGNLASRNQSRTAAEQTASP